MTKIDFISEVVKQIAPIGIKVEIFGDYMIVGKAHFYFDNLNFSLFTSQLDISILFNSITDVQYYSDNSLFITTNNVRYVSIKL